MKLKKVLAVSLAAAMTLSMAACGGSSSDSSAASDDATTGSVAATTTESGDAAETTDGALNYASIKLGEDYTDITTTIHVFNQRTDMSEDSYPGKNWEAYIADFNEMYPNITVEVETDTNYSDDSLLRLQSGDWGDIMMIPAVDKADLSEYFLPYGTLDEMEGQIKFANTWDYDGLVYGVPSTARHRVLYTTRESSQRPALQRHRRHRMSSSRHCRQSRITILPSFRSTRTMQTDGRWSSGTDRSQVRQPVILPI